MIFNQQQMFDFAYKGVIKQDGPGVANDDCAYLSDDTGNRCGIGHVLKEVPDTPDEIWDSMEPAQRLRKFFDPPWSKDNDPFVAQLQCAHDSAYNTADDSCGEFEFIDEFKINMIELANRFQLTVPESYPGIPGDTP